MSTPADDRHCPRCFAPLRRSESPEGLCPKCLLAVGMGEDAVIRTHTGAPVPAPPALAELRPHFEGLDILSLIGRGGAGAVYRATQRDLGRQVALKVLLLDPEVDPAFGERFVREARAMASLNHPNIAAVHDAGRAGPYWYLVMEFVDGPNLRQLIQSRDLAASEALDVVRQICDALEYAHGEGVVHRDIKPENVLVDSRGRVKLVDFGLAKLLGGALGLGAGGATLTRSSQAMGTWHYMAPEQLRRPLEVDHRADIYSLGVVLYELLTGEVPQGRYAPVSERSRADRRLDAIVDRALEQDPSRRYQEASGVREDVVRVQSGPEEQDEAASGTKAPPAPRRERQSKGDTSGRGAQRESAPKASRSFLGGCLVVLIVGFLLFVFGALLLTMWASPSMSSQTESRPVSIPELSPGPKKLAATLQSLYPTVDVTDAAVGAWNRYRLQERKHVALAAFRHGERAWAQVDILPFPVERDLLIDTMLREVDPVDSYGRHAAIRAKIEENDVLPSGARLRTFEIERMGRNKLNIALDGAPYRESVPVTASADAVLRPIMQQLRSPKELERVLSEAEELPWSHDQIGVQSAPAAAYRALAAWWSQHLELEERHTSSRVVSDPAGMIFEVEPFAEEIEVSRNELRASMTAAIGHEAWDALETEIDWDALVPLGQSEGDHVSVAWADLRPSVEVRTGSVGKQTYADRLPWHLNRFLDRARVVAPLGTFAQAREDTLAFDLELVLPGALVLLREEDWTELRSIALEYRALESQAFDGPHRSLRAAGGGHRLTGWPLGKAPEAPVCSVLATIDAFPSERAVLETRLLARLAELPVRIDTGTTDRMVRALLPFGERRAELVRDEVGDVTALLAIDAETRETSLAWIGRAHDWRVERFLRNVGGPISSDKEHTPGACLSQSLLERAAEGVVPSDLDIRVPGEGATLLLSRMPVALQSDRAAVELAESCWVEFANLMSTHARWTRWTRGKASWSQLDVDPFPAEWDNWLTASVGRAGTPELGAAFAESLSQIESLLPGRHASAEIARLDDGALRIFEGACARKRAVFEALEEIGDTLPVPDEAREFDALTIEAVWPYVEAPPAASIQERILAIREAYLALEAAALRPYHDVSGSHELELRIGAFADDRAPLLGELQTIRQGAIDAHGINPQTADLCEHVVPLGRGPASVHLSFVDGRGIVDEIDFAEGGAVGVDPARMRHLTDPSLLTDAEFFCDPTEIGLPTDLPPAARWAVATTRRDYLALVEKYAQLLRAEVPPFPRPDGAVRRLASEGNVLRLPAIANEIQNLSSRMTTDLEDLGVTIVDAEALYRGLFPFGDVPVDIAAREQGDTFEVVVEVLGPAGDALDDVSRVRTIFEGADPGWRWSPFFMF